MIRWPDPRTSLGLRTWPQWRGWRHCPVTGDLIDPDGQTYTPEGIRAAGWIMQCWEFRNRLMLADDGRPRPLLTTADMLPKKRVGRGGRRTLAPNGERATHRSTQR